MLALPDKYYGIDDQFAALIDVHNHYVDVLNDAIDLHNSGDISGASGGALRRRCHARSTT